MSSFDVSYIEDLPSGPLDKYRKLSKLNFKQLRVFFEGAESLKIKVKIINVRYYLK